MFAHTRYARSEQVGAVHRRPIPAVTPLRSVPRLQAKSNCACGGSCPACRESVGLPVTTDAELKRQPLTANPARLQAKLKVGAADDVYEREADAIAERVMRMTDTDLTATDSSGIRSSSASQQAIRRQPLEDEEEEVIQTKRADAAASVSAEAGAAIGALTGGGRPLNASTRAFFEPRFGADFSQVRIHDGVAAHTATGAVNARAFAWGRHIAFAPGEYAPDTTAGRLLMAHELAHVRQQEKQAGEPIVQRRPVTMRDRRTGRRRTFEVGGVRVANTAARDDILRQRVLLPGEDQAHIATSGDLLGYEVSHTDPEDPFRWEKLKDIIDNGALDITAVSITDTIPTRLITGGTTTDVDITLFGFGASGITLPRESLQRAIWRTQPSIATSDDPSRDKIFYETRGGAASLLGSNSLAHELFGHYWLALNGKPWAHPPTLMEALRQARSRGQTLTPDDARAITERHTRLGTLTAAHGVTDPFGNVFVGTVREYIDRFAGAEAGRVESPTRRVGTAHLAHELTELRRSLLASGGLTLSGGVGNMSADAANHWAFVSLNYEVLRQPPAHTPTPSTTTPPGSTPPSGSSPTTGPNLAPGQSPPQSAPVTPTFTADSVVTTIADMWQNDFSADQKAAFENLISSTLSASFLSSIPDALGRDVRTEIGRRRAAQSASP